MAWLQLANNAQTVLGGVVSLLATSITPSSKAGFPDPDVDGSFYVTLSDPGFANPTDDSTRETVLVTANDGAAWTVTRAQCGTSAQEHEIADRVSLYLMAEHLEEIEAAVDLNTAARHAAVTVADTTSVDLTLTGQQLSAVVLPAGVNHDALAGFVGNEHIDWTADQEGAAVVHSGNYVDNDTQYTAGDGLALAAGVFSLDPAWVDQVLATTGTPQFGRLGLGAAAGTARITLVEGTTAADGIDFGGDATLYRSAANVLSTDDSLSVALGAVINEGGGDYDTRVEGDTDVNLIYVDAGNDRVGIGTATPAAKLSLAEGTTAASGIAFGTDVSLYRSAANVLKTDDALHIGGRLYLGTASDMWLQYVSHTSRPSLNIYPASGEITGTRIVSRCIEGVGNNTRFVGATTDGNQLTFSNCVGYLSFETTQCSPSALKGKVEIWVNTGDLNALAVTFGDDKSALFAGAITAPQLTLTSTTAAFLPPRMTTTQRDAIASPAAGMVVYNTTTNVLNFYNGSAWGAV